MWCCLGTRKGKAQMTKRGTEISQQIKNLESEKGYINSMISLLMSEANLIDMEIEGFTHKGLSIEEKLRDLRAELKDTI